MSNSFTTRAIILKRRNVGETDRLLTLFTREAGRMTVRAKGVRAATSKRGAHIELFNTVKAQIIEGRGMPILAQTEIISDRSALKTDIKLLRIAYHIVEVVDRLTADRQPQTEVYELLERALSSVNLSTWKEEDRLVAAFEAKLLTMLGFGVPYRTPDEIHRYIEELIDAHLKSRKILET